MGRRAFAAAAALVALVAGCTASHNSPSGVQRSTPNASAPTSHGPTPTAPTTSKPKAAHHPFVGLVDMVNPGFVLVVAGPDGSGGGRLRLLATTVTGRRFREIGPRHVRHMIADRLFALDRRHIWFAAFLSGGGGERLYRTSDGGRTWHGSWVPGHVLAAGSTDDLQFVNANDGWLADEEPTGPEEDLYRTTNGGATWRPVAHMRRGNRTAGLPEVGDVWFGAGTGWLGGPTSSALYTSTDGGRQWRDAAVPGPRRARHGRPLWYGLPAVFGSTAVEPVTACVHGPRTLLIYRRDAASDSWSHSSSWRQPGGGFDCARLSVALPSPNVSWAATVVHKVPVVGRTVDDRHWVRVARPTPRARFVSIYATDSARAWVLADGRIHVTTDGGQSWRSLRVP